MDNKKAMAYKKILIINLSGIGDMVLSIPALRALRKHYPGTAISLLTTRKVYEVVKDLPFIDYLYLFGMSYGGRFSLPDIIRNAWVIGVLRKERFDLGINMRTLVSAASAKKIKFLFSLIHPRATLGRDTEGRGTFFDIKIPETQQGKKYEMEYDIDTVRAIGVKVDDTTIEFAVGENNRERVAAMLKKRGISDTAVLVGVHPGGMPSRRWPLENFSRMIDAVSREKQCVFVLTGGKDEVSIAGALKQEHKREAVSLAGILTIKDLGALIERCAVFISNDTGPMHIAAVLKTPLVALFGPGDITRFDPRNISKKAVVFYEKKECAPCDKVRCDDQRCLKAITPEDVARAVLDMLERKDANAHA
jgi:ADP-heptose:LPS heptosyltransferase